MEKTDLEELAERLQDRYIETKKHYEIVKAVRTPTGWALEINEIRQEDGKNESHE